MILGYYDKVLYFKLLIGFLFRDFFVVEYVKYYYFGRVFEVSGLFVKIKFFYKVGVNIFD